MKKILNKIQTGTILLLALGTPVLAVLDEKYWFEKRVALAGAAVVLLALLAVRVWARQKPPAFKRVNDIGWLVFGAALVVGAVVPAGRIANLMAPDLWAAVGAVLAFFAIRGTLTNSKQIKWGFFGILGGALVAAILAATRIGYISPIGPIPAALGAAGEILQRSPVLGEFREFRTAKLGTLQIAGGLGILGILGTLALAYQLTLKSVKEIFKSSSIWWKVLSLLVLVLLAAFLILPHPALTLWPLAVTTSLACGLAEKGGKGLKGMVERTIWAIFVGLLIITVLASSYGLGRAVWGEMKFREALAAANRNEGIATYYALLESIKRNPYEARYHLLASQIDLALANSIAAQAGGDEEEASPSAQLTTQDRNNILILIQQAVVRGKAAVNLDPHNSGLWQNLGSIYRSLVGVAGGAEDWALKCYQRGAELNPKDPNPHLRIGEIHFLGGNFDGATESFRKVVELAPNLARGHYNLAVALNALGETDKAIEELRQTLALLPADDPSREQVEKDLAFLKGDTTLRVDEETLRVEPPGAEKTEELKEATSSAEVESPPPPVGPEATESAKPEEPELEEGPIEVVP